MFHAENLPQANQDLGRCEGQGRVAVEWIMGASGKMKPEQAHKKTMSWDGISQQFSENKKEHWECGSGFHGSMFFFFCDVVKLTCFQMHSQGGKFHSREMLNFEGEDDRILMVQESGSKPGMYAKTLLKRCKCQYIVHTWQFFVTIFGFG